MTDATDLRFDFIGWATSRLGVTEDDVAEAVLIGAAETAATTHGDHTKQEWRDGQESDERRPREKRLLCA